jgi:hypothetical protein
MYMLFVRDICSFCEQGQVGFTMCADHETLVLVCDECYAVWIDPRETSVECALFPNVHDFTVPELNCSLAGARWATKEEIEEKGWGDYVVGSREISDKM